MCTGKQIADPGFERRDKAYVANRRQIHANGIIEKAMAIVNPRYPAAGEHYFVFTLGIGPTACKRNISAGGFVVHGRHSLHGKDVRPPCVDTCILGKESVSANIHAIAIVADRSGYAADLVALFQDDNTVFSRRLKQFQGCCQSGGTGANDDDIFHPFILLPVLWC